MAASLLCRALLGLTLAGAALPAGAQAEAIPLGLKSDSIDVAMTADGAAHVARFTYVGLRPTLVVCRIPAGGTTCTQTGSAQLPRDDGTGPFIVARGNRVTAVAGSADGANEATYAMTALVGTSYGALSQVASITAEDVELSPAGDRLWITAPSGPAASAADYIAFASAPLPGGVPTAAAATLQSTPGGRSFTDRLVGVRPDGKPLAFLSGVSNALAAGDYFYPFNGAPAADAELNDPARWGAATRFDLPAPDSQNGGYELASAPGRLWLAYEGLGTDVLLRRWDGAGFGPAISPDCRYPGRFSAGSQDAPALAVTRTGDLQLAYTGSDGTNLHLVYFRGTPDASQFTPYQELYTGPDDQRDVEIASDPTSDTGGIVVWTADDIYQENGDLKFSRLPATAVAPSCPPPAVATSPTPTVPPATPTPAAPGGNPPRNPQVPPATPTPAAPGVKPPVTRKSPSVASLVSGLPSTKRCVSRRSFKIRLRNPKGFRISSAKVKVDGRLVATRKGKRLTSVVNLKGLPKGRYKVTISVRLTNGRTVTATRKYRTCGPKKRR